MDTPHERQPQQTLSPLLESDGLLNRLRDRRDALREQGRPGEFQKKERAAYDDERRQLDKSIEAATGQRDKGLEGATPEERATFGRTLHDRQLAHDDAQAVREGNERLPSQSATSAEDKAGRFQRHVSASMEGWVPPSLSDWRAAREQGRGGASQQSRPRYEAFLEGEKRDSAERHAQRAAERERHSPEAMEREPERERSRAR